MTPSLYCLLFFAGWTLLPLGYLLGSRSHQVLVAGKPPNAFKTGTYVGSERYERVMRAHANCVENLPVFATVVLIGAAIGLVDPVFDRLAIVYVGARVGQSGVHIASGSSAAVNVRFGLFVAQIACVVAMGIRLIGQV